MPEPLKNRYNRESVRELALRIRAVYHSFQVNDFVNGIMDNSWPGLELKARMRQITLNLGRYLPADYERALGVIDRVAAGYPAGFNDFALMYFPDFVEVYGRDERHWGLSMAALERYTPLSSSEFAVRPFIIEHEERMMAQMALWTAHENEHVRRLASERGLPPAAALGTSADQLQREPDAGSRYFGAA